MKLYGKSRIKGHSADTDVAGGLFACCLTILLATGPQLMQRQLDPKMPAYRLHNRLGYRLSRLSKITQERLEARLAVHAMSRLTWCVLSSVEWEQIRTPSDLAMHIGINRPAISRALVQLRNEGLIIQSSSESDGRSREITLTNQGMEKLLICRPLVDEVESHYSSKLSVKDMRVFEALLDKLLLGEDVLVDKL